MLDQILKIGIVKFGEANCKVLTSNFILFFTLALVFYLALFVKDNGDDAAPATESDAPAAAPATAEKKPRARTTSTPRKRAESSAVETPKKAPETPASPRGTTPKRGRKAKSAVSDAEATETEDERAKTPSRKSAKKVDLGQVTSPDGKRTSVRLRSKTPAKL